MLCSEDDGRWKQGWERWMQHVMSDVSGTLRVIPDSLIYLLVTVRAVPAESAPRGNKFARLGTSRGALPSCDWFIKFWRQSDCLWWILGNAVCPWYIMVADGETNLLVFFFLRYVRYSMRYSRFKLVPIWLGHVCCAWYGADEDAPRSMPEDRTV